MKERRKVIDTNFDVDISDWTVFGSELTEIADDSSLPIAPSPEYQIAKPPIVRISDSEFSLHVKCSQAWDFQNKGTFESSLGLCSFANLLWVCAVLQSCAVCLSPAVSSGCKSTVDYLSFPPYLMTKVLIT